MKKVLFAFGTRPEAIKMAPLLKLFMEDPRYATRVCVSGQHREMLDQVLHFFGIIPDYDLKVMKNGQDMFHLTSDVLTGMQPVLEDFAPDYVFVQGDTITAMSAALAAYYGGIPVCHVEAGLRTYNKTLPFPEEVNRQLISRIADLHFAPTHQARANLIAEGISPSRIHLTGNTVIDALLWAEKRIGIYEDADMRMLKDTVLPGKKLIVVTSHRKENFGSGILEICQAIQMLAERDDVQVIFPVHLNPNIKGPVYAMLNEIDYVTLTSPLSYPAFVWLMRQAYLIVSDSGGIQEEAPALGKPLLLMREATERPEAVACGNVKLIGKDRQRIVKETVRLLDDRFLYDEMSVRHHPYGDGEASKRIIEFLNG